MTIRAQARLSGVKAKLEGIGVTVVTSTPEQLEGEYDVSLYFDVKDLDMEFVFKKLDAIAKMAVPLDRAGVIDTAAMVKLIVTSIDPTYAQALIRDEQGAAQAVYKDVDAEVLRMFAGNEADYVENDPTAKMKPSSTALARKFETQPMRNSPSRT